MTDFSGYRFYKFRYTPREGQHKRIGQHAWSAIVESYLDSGEYYASCGFEKLNNLNESTHPHLHFHFAIKTEKDLLGAMRKRFQRYIKLDGDETRKGNVLYSLAEESDVKDINRFLRYVWKQGGREHLGTGWPYEKLPSEMEIDLEIALAREEQERMWEFNIKKREKQMAPDTRDKLFEYLDDCHQQENFLGKKQILIKICEFYGTPDEKGNMRSANKQTILGYLQTALWKYKLETFEETAEQWLK